MRYIVTIEPAKDPEPKRSLLQELALGFAELIQAGLGLGAIIVFILIIANAQ